MFTYDYEKSELNNFGVGYLAIDEAAELIAKCLFFEDELDIKCEIEINSIFDSRLDGILKEQITNFRARLIAAVADGTLKTEKIQRDLNESIIAESTFINSETLCGWLADRNIDLGDYYFHDYIEFQSDIFCKIQKTIESEYIKKNNPDVEEQIHRLDEDDCLGMFDRIAKLEAELSRLSDNPKEKSLSTRERDTLLKLVLGMAIGGYRYDPKKARNNAIGDIEKDLQSLGIPLDQDTIRKWLKESAETHSIQDQSDD